MYEVGTRQRMEGSAYTASTYLADLAIELQAIGLWEDASELLAMAQRVDEIRSSAIVAGYRE